MGFMILFLFWGALCVGAVLRRRMGLWAALCLVPLGIISFIWWADHAQGVTLEHDPFGLDIFQILAFVAMSFITAATGALSLVVSSSPRSSGKDAPNGGCGSEKQGYTVWQVLWWKPLPKAD